jgi:rRNA-processing protein FCF1
MDELIEKLKPIIREIVREELEKRNEQDNEEKSLYEKFLENREKLKKGEIELKELDES